MPARWRICERAPSAATSRRVATVALSDSCTATSLAVTLKSVTAAYGVPFIPMVELGIAGTNYYSSGDPIHFNDRGAERFASGLAAKLFQRHLIPATNTGEDRSLAERDAGATGPVHGAR